MNLINLFSNQSDFSTILLLGVVFGFLGAFTLISAMFPPFQEVYKTKKTFALTTIFLKISIGTGLSFGFASVFGFLNAIIDENLLLSILFLIMILSNFIAAGMNYYFYQVKLSNVAASEKHNISEMEYWNKFLNNSNETVQTVVEEVILESKEELVSEPVEVISEKVEEKPVKKTKKTSK